MAKLDVTPTSLTKEQLSNLAQVTKDVFFFSNFVYVVHPVRGKVQFNLYPYQKSVLYNFIKERFNIILKFRQAGITELISLYCLWLTMYHPNKKVNIISIKDSTAKKVLKKIKFMYKNLPWYLQTPIINGRAGEYGSASLMEFSNGSFIESIPTSSEAGRSESLTLLVIDEAAIVRWASQIWAAAFPTLSSATGDTPIIVQSPSLGGKKPAHKQTRVLKLRELCPKSPGVLDLSPLKLKTLTHEGKWKQILWGQNKGKLEAWILKDERGKKIGVSPKHRFYTPRGWKTAEEIINQDLYVIQAETGLSSLKVPKPVKAPLKEELKPIDGFPNYLVSNLGNIYLYSDKGLKLVPQRYNKDGYLRVALRINGCYRTTGSTINRGKTKTFHRSVHRLVAKAFLGPIPKGYQVDHINCHRDQNFVTNLRYVNASVNVSRAYEYNISAKLSSISGNRLPDLQKRAKILLMHKEGFSYSEIAKEVYPETKQGKKFVKRLLTERGSGSRIYISKLTLVKKVYRYIYDVRVEDNKSYISANNYINHNTGGSAIINSTPYGLSNWYHSTWVDAISGGNDFNAIRLFWRMHPERDDEWYRSMSTALGPKRTAQEIDGDFLGSGNSVFDLVDIKAIEDCLPDYPPIKRRFNGQYLQFTDPDLNKEYFIGADVSTGRASDYSSFTCMDREGEEQVVYKGRMPVDKYAKLLGDTGTLYNNAVLAPESNDVGLAVTSFLQTEGYPKLYYYQKMVRKKGKSRPEVDKSPGWLTTNKNRSVIIDGLENDVRNGVVTIKDPFFIHEAYTFIYDSMGRPVAMGKHKANSAGAEDLETEVYADDDIMGKAICNHIRKGKANVIVTPK